MTFIKKTLLVFLFSVIGFSLSVCAETFGDVTYTKDNNQITITGLSSTSSTSVTIPSEIEGLPVTSIGVYAFMNSSLTSVTIPNSVTTIRDNAFYNCRSLTSVTIPDSVSFIDYRAFDNCSSLTSVIIPDSVSSISDHTFNNCTSLTSITIPDSVTTIRSGAFYNCTSLASVTIPNSVTTIGNYAFYNCTGLTSVAIPDSVTSIESCAFENCSSLTSVTIPDSVTSIGYNAFYKCANIISVIIPDSIISIGSNAFSSSTIKYCGINTNGAKALSKAGYSFIDPQYPELYFKQSYSGDDITGLVVVDADEDSLNIIIPDSVTSIGGSAFKNCSSLTSITIPNSVTSIGGNAFENCSSLISITIPDAVTYIYASTFSGCSSLSSVIISDSIASIGNNTFENCSCLASIIIPDSVTSIGGSAFKNCSSLTSITIPNSVTSIGSNAFESCSSLISITIPDAITYIYASTFTGCSSLTSVTIPDTVISVDSKAFLNCTAVRYCTINTDGSKALSKAGYSFVDPQYPGLFLKYSYSGNDVTGLAVVDADADIVNATIPVSVTSIDESAFNGCSSLSTLTIPETVNSIGKSAFYGCSSLSTITIPNSITTISTAAFSGCSAKRYSSINTGGSKALSKAGYAFIDPQYPSLYLRYLYSGDEIIDLMVYDADDDIIDALIPDSVTSIGNNAFSNCTTLSSITISNSVISIGSSAFSGCTSLASIVIPNSVTSIGDFAFSDCTSLTTISIPNSVTAIGKAAFTKCSALSSITLADSVTSIGDSAFSYCSSLSSITIPDSVTSIGNSAFYDCSNLLSITIPDSVTFIGSQAFRACTRLTSVSLPDSITTIESLTFSGCSKLSSITIPSTVTTIGSNAFNSCSSLTYIDFPDSVTSIGPGAFAHCYGFLSITIPKTVTSIGSEAFRSCTDLFSITLSDPETSITIGERAFWDCANIEKVYISSSIHDLPDVLFSYSNKLTIYCHEYSDADFWASNLGYNIVYVDSTDFSTVQTVELFPQQLTIPKGYNGKLLGTVFPDVSVPGLIWSSSAPGIASVDETGTVSALSKGTAVISLTVGDKTATASVECYVPVESFSFPEEEWILAKSSLSLMTKDYYPADADPVFSWASSDETIATVDQSGLVTAKKPGDVQITITSDTGIQKSCIVHFCYPVTGISFDADTLVIPAQTQTLLVTHVTMRDQHCDNHLVQFSSSDESIATIDENGMITPLKTGMVTFTATAESGVTASIECSVMPCSQHTEVIDPAVAPTCTENGLTQGSHCSVCGTVITRQESVPALGHDWNDATYSWAADNSTVTATHICKRDATHTETETATVTTEVTKPAACEVAGETTYSAAFTNAAFAPQNKTLADIPATGHDWGEANYTWAEDNKTVIATHTCKRDNSHVETETATVTTEVSKPSACEEAGETTYTAAFTNTNFDAQMRVLADIPPLGHTPILVPGKLPSSGKSGHTSGNICSVCGKVLADHLPVESVQTLALPVALRTVADSAFARTAADHVLLPAGATAIGPRAFADAPNLRFVTVPDSVNSIAPDAFEGCSLLTFFCSDSSAAAAYAEAHGFAHTAP